MNQASKPATFTPAATPSKSRLFAPTVDAYGARLALVFGNESKTGACPFYERECFHCDIGAGEGEFTPALNRERLRFYRDHYAGVLPDLRHLVLYNSGSLLNPRELSPATLDHLLEFARDLANCVQVSLDSRELFVQAPIITRLLAGLRAGQQLRIILGLETQDDHARSSVLNKRMSKPNIARAFAVLGRCRRRAGAELNLMFQPPGISPADAVAEASRTIQYGLELSRDFGVPVDFNFHPYYRSVIGSQHFPAHPRASLADAIEAITEAHSAIDRAGADSKLYLGWFDEGHDQDEALRAREIGVHLAGFLEFNRTQNPACLAAKP